MYREHAISAALRSVAVCTWQHESAAATCSRVVPDACVDLVWNGTGVSVAGPDTGPVVVALRAGAQLVGLRFVPGAAGALLGAPARALRDARVSLRELWGDSACVLEERLHAAADVHDACEILEAAVSARVQASAPLDPLMVAVARALRPSLAAPVDHLAMNEALGQVPSVGQLAAALGVGERQLLRRCDAAFGYGPKLLARVLRFQAFVNGLQTHPQLGLAELALALGYADQAHLTHDTMELAGQTPGQLQRS